VLPFCVLLLGAAPIDASKALVDKAVSEAHAAALEADTRCSAQKDEAAMAACRGVAARAWMQRLRKQLQAGGPPVVEAVRAQQKGAQVKTPRAFLLTLAQALLEPAAVATAAQGDRPEELAAHQQRVAALCLTGAFAALEKALPRFLPAFAAMDLGVVVRDTLDPKGALAVVQRAEADAQVAPSVRAAARLLLALHAARSAASTVALGQTLGACIDAPERSLVVLRLAARCEGSDGGPSALGACVEAVRTVSGKAVTGAFYANLYGVAAPLGTPALGCAAPAPKKSTWVAPVAVLLGAADLEALDRVYPAAP
jgi:hypothetical protein